MLNNIANKVIQKFQAYEESNYPVSVILPMRRVLQLDNYSCGLQSAYVILRYFGKVDSVDDVKYDGRLNIQKGIDTDYLLKILKTNGLVANINENATIDDITDALVEGNPILISIDNDEHWIVVYGFSEDRIFVLDSSLRSSVRCSWSVEEFLKRWDDNWIVVIKN
jgi:ABC-type bacteriocin/lantibiotic exporter with double-glycine peptidase domain